MSHAGVGVWGECGAACGARGGFFFPPTAPAVITLSVFPPALSVITMSRGPGAVERRIADLFAATRDRALSIDVITRHAFETSRPTRAQRLSATRAAHRLLRRGVEGAQPCAAGLL